MFTMRNNITWSGENKKEKPPRNEDNKKDLLKFESANKIKLKSLDYLFTVT